MRLRNHAGPHGLAAVEVPLGRWKEVAVSKLGIRDMLYVPFELLAIWRRTTCPRGRAATAGHDEPRSQRAGGSIPRLTPHIQNDSTPFT